jgi:transcriptional regulator with XRE-family HTH domain
MDREEFAANFKAARIKAGYTQQTAADACGMGRVRIAEYEIGRHSPTVDALVTIVDALELDLAILFPHWFDPQPEPEVQPPAKKKKGR